MIVENLAIKVPLFMFPGGGFGIASDRLDRADAVCVTCSYKTADGKLLHPHKYLITSNKAKLYRTTRKNGRTLHLIPKDAFTVVD